MQGSTSEGSVARTNTCMSAMHLGHCTHAGVRTFLMIIGTTTEVNPRDLYKESGQTLQGSCSAVSKPIFGTNCSLETSRRLHIDLGSTTLQSQIVCQILI